MRWGAVTCLVLLSGCTFFAHRTPFPSDAEPVPIEEVQNRLLAGNPTARAFSARAITGREVIFAIDGTATFIPAHSADPIETTVSGFEDNTICLAKAGDWPGLCIDVYQTENGQYFCDGTFGDGWASRYFCALIPAPEDERN